MKHDIEKIKREFTERLAIAELENKLNEGCEGYYFHATKRGIYNRDAEFYIHVSLPSFSEHSAPTLQQVREVLGKFPVTQMTTHEGVCTNYLMNTSRHFGDKYGQLSILWQSGKYEVSVSLDIDTNKEMKDEFFRINKRETVESENSTYASIQRYDKQGNYLRYSVPVYDFKKKQKCFYGGHRLLEDNEEVQRIIDYILQQ